MTGLARIEDAVAAIGRGEIVVVVDDEDRENEGDLIMAAEFATPDNDRLLPAAHVRRDLRHVDVRAGTAARPGADGPAQHRDAAHGVPRHRRLPPRHDDGDLGGRPGGHDPRPRRLRHQARRPAAPGTHLPAGGPRRRRAQARRAHRGGDRPGAHGRLRARRRAVRDRQRGQARDGQAPGAGGVLHGTRPADDLHRRPHPPPPAHREARAARRHGTDADVVGRVRADRLRGRARRQPTPRVRARRRRRRRRARSCACTASASPATCSGRASASAGARSTRRCGASPTTARACWCTCAATRAAASASPTRSTPPESSTRRSTRRHRRTAASTASGRRSSPTSASPRCA